MEVMNEIRDSIFWWVGNWALFTGLDAGIIAIILRIRRPQAIETLREIEREFTENLARAITGMNQAQEASADSGTQEESREGTQKKGSRK